ncbi:MAG: hypothetical protein L6435_11315 [Anaerolineae bacterium]|nr:hypothetical protein [Anaerolineae bacterium]
MTEPKSENFVAALHRTLEDPDLKDRVLHVLAQSPELSQEFDIRSPQQQELTVEFVEAVVEIFTRNKQLRDSLAEQYRCLIHDFLYSFSASPDVDVKQGQEYDLLTFRRRRKEIMHLRIQQPCRDPVRAYYDQLVEQASDARRAKALKECASEFVWYARSLSLSSPEAKYLCYLGKALLTLVLSQQTPSSSRRQIELAISAHVVPEICAFVVVADDNPEQQRTFLNRLIEHERSYAAQCRLFESMLRRLKEERDPDHTSMTSAVSLITEHQIRLYDFSGAAKTLDILEKRPWLLSLASSLYNRTLRWFAACTAFMAVVLGLAFILMVWVPMDSFIGSILAGVDFLLVIAACLATAAFIIIILWRTWKDEQRFPYFQLFFPRLLGAIVVGFTPLVLDDSPWKIGTNSDYLTLAIIGLFTYVGSFAYLLFDAYKAFRAVGGPRLKDVVRSACKLYLIGLMQSCLVALIVSSLLYPVIVGPAIIGSASADSAIVGSVAVDSFFIDPANRRGIMLTLEALVGIPHLLTLGVYPALIFAWSGIALFVGSFVQLIWQGGRVTEPL